MTRASQSVAAGHPGASPHDGRLSSRMRLSKPILRGWPYARIMGPDIALGIPASSATIRRMSSGSRS
eukprot:1496790-Heterocapsa_arctica.AAC.1